MAVETDKRADKKLANRLLPSQETASDETIQRAQASIEQIEALQQEIEEVNRADFSLPDLGFELPVDFCLSIVVPVYNERATINRVIASLFALPIPVEVIAVDDGSTDGSCAMLTRLNQEFPDLIVIVQETNQGKGAA